MIKKRRHEIERERGRDRERELQGYQYREWGWRKGVTRKSKFFICRDDVVVMKRDEAAAARAHDPPAWHLRERNSNPLTHLT